MYSIETNRTSRPTAGRGLFARLLSEISLASLLLVGCDVHGISAPGELASISVSPNATLVAGTTQQMTAVGFDAEGRIMQIAPTWSVAASGGVIAAGGVFTAGSVIGLFANTVVASVGSIEGRASITVIAGELATITVVPTPVTLTVLGTQQFIAVGRDVSGNIVPFVPTWSVVASGGSIDQAGMFTAGGTVGTFTNTVQASHDAIKGYATVIVTSGPLASIAVSPNPAIVAVGTAQQFTAVGKDASGNVLAIEPVWSETAGGGTIDAATGLFTAGNALGTYTNTVKATSGSVSGTATVTVVAGVLATITITPNPATMAVGGSQQLTAVGRDVGGNTVAITPAWDVVTASNGASITQGGLYTAGTVVGTFPNKVRATSGSISGYATMIATTGVLTSITVTPNPVFLPTAGTQQFAAVGTDASGNVFLITPNWTVVNGGGSIDPNTGLFTAGMTAGTFAGTVVATSGTVSGSATVTVGAILSSIEVSPTPVSVHVGTTQQFSAVGRDMTGGQFAIMPVWSVVSGGGSIDATTGVFTAGSTTGTFTSTVRATIGATFGTATVTVTPTPPALASLTVFPGAATMLVNGTQQFEAVGRDSLGHLFPSAPVWSVISGGGSIDAITGWFTAGTVTGTFVATVQARMGAVTGTATVTITAAPPVLTMITVTPNPKTLVPGGVQQFTAVGTDAHGSVIAITPTWSIVAGGGTISGTGYFTAGAVPGTFANTVRATSGSLSGFATVIVTKAAQAITFAAPATPATYGSTFAIAPTASSGLPVTVTPSGGCTVVGSTVTMTSGTTACVLTASQAGSLVFSAALDVVQTVAAAKRAASVTPTAAEKTFGAADPSPITTGTLVGFLAGDGVTATYARIAGEAVGTYVISATLAPAGVLGNYTITYNTALFTIGKVAQTITFAAPVTPATYGSTFAIAPTASSGLPVTVTPSGGCTLSGLTVTMTSGTTACVLTASQAGTDSFTAATPVVQTVAAATRAASVTPAVAGKLSGAADPSPITTGTLVGFLAGDGVTATYARIAGEAVGTYVISATLAPAGVLGDYTITYNTALFTINALLTTTQAVPSTVGIAGTLIPTFTPVTASGGTLPYAFALTGGTLPTGMSFSTTTGAVSGTPSTTLALTTFTVTVTDAVTATSSKTFNLTVNALLTTTQAVPSTVGTVNTLIPTFTPVTASGGTTPYTYALSGGTLPTGMSFNTSTGAVSGTPTTLLPLRTFTVTVTDALAATSSKTFELTVTLLASAANFSVLGNTKLTCVGPSTIAGSVGIATGTDVADFAGTCVSSPGNPVVPHINDAPANAAQADLTAALTALAAMSCDSTIATLGGATLTAGVYCSGSSVGVTGDVTLTGDANSVFVIRAGSTLTTAGNVVMGGTAQAKNVYWYVGTSATIGSGSQWQGSILAATSITLVNGANLNGRTLASGGAVTLGTNTITLP